MSEPVTADIESLCAKCGDVWHVVVAKVGEKIAKVQCKQCGAVHRHRPPGSAATATATAAAATRGRPAAARKKAAAAPPSAPAPTIDPARPTRPYAPGDSFVVGDQLSHPSFGTGVVESLLGPGKMQVYFPGGRRVLAQARTAPTLERPTTWPARDE